MKKFEQVMAILIMVATVILVTSAGAVMIMKVLGHPNTFCVNHSYFQLVTVIVLSVIGNQLAMHRLIWIQTHDYGEEDA